MTPRSKPRRGFVILFALGILLYGTATLGMMAAEGAGRALHAKTGAETLIRKWSGRVAEKTLLTAARSMLTRVVETQRGAVAIPIRELKGEWKLNHLTMKFVIADESAKLDLNAFGGDRSMSVESLTEVVELAAPQEGGVRNILVRPLSEASRTSVGGASFVNPDQLIDPSSERAGIDVMDSVTLWGDGRINIKTASANALRGIAARRVSASDLSRLQRMTQGAAGISLAEALKKLDLSGSNQRWMESKLTEQSTTYSVNLVIDDGWSTEYRYSVVRYRSSGRGQRVFACYR